MVKLSYNPRQIGYRILDFENSVDMEKELERISNLVNDYGGRVYGTQPIEPSTHWVILISFEVPSVDWDKFLVEEKSVRQNEATGEKQV